MRQVTNYISRSFLLLVSLIYMGNASAQRQNAIYNYRIDGGINAFINDDIDSITYSNIGLDSIEYDNIVVQEIWTAYGVHRFALEEVDSIAFQTPEPKLRDNIFFITEEHLPYTIRTDSLHITFLPTIPFFMAPQVGQVVISDIDEAPFEDGFAGRVTSIKSNQDSVLVTCEAVNLCDIFERLLIAKKVVSQTEDEVAGAPQKVLKASEKRHWWDIYEDEGDGQFTIPFDLSASAFNGMFSANSKKPQVTCVWCLDVNPLGYKANFDFLVKHEEVSFDMKLSLPQVGEDFHLGEGEKDESKDEYGWSRKKLTIGYKCPIVAGLVDFGFEFGVGFKGSIDFEGKWTTSATQKLNFDIYGKNLDVMTPPVVIIHESNTQFGEIKREASISVNGGIQLSLKPSFTLKLLSKNLLSAEAYVEGGIEGNATWQISSKDRPLDYSMYELFKDVSLSSDCYVQGGVNATLVKYKVAALKGKKSWEIGKWYMFPHLTAPELPEYIGNSSFKDKVSPTSLIIHPTHDVLKNATLGLELYNDKGELVNERYSQYEYDTEKNWWINSLEMPLKDLSAGNTYTCHPVIKFNLWGKEGKIDVESLSKEVTIPEEMTIAKTVVSLHKGKNSAVEILGGWGTYELTCSDSKVASATLLELPSLGKRFALVQGLKTGTTQLKVKDVRTNVTETINVTVEGEGGTLSLAGGSYQLKVGDEKSVEIIDGSGHFTAESSNEQVATCRIEGCLVVVTAVGEGMAVITVTDTQTGETAELEVAVAANHGGDVPTEGLVAYYPFNGNANDESGNENNGSVIGNVELTADRFGNPNSAYRFSGSPFNYISVPDNETLHCSTFTLNAWVYTDADNYGYGRTGWLINKGRDINSGSYNLRVTSVCGTVAYGVYNVAYIEEIPETHVWHMITGTLEGNVAKFYLDGVLMDERQLSRTFVYGNSDPLTLGMHYYGGVPSVYAYPLLGVLDDVRIYNRVLTDEEIKALYQEP